jgi:hypothetical protein
MNFNYNQEDFVEKNYKKLLKKIKNKTIFYNEIKAHSKFCLWRHDIDLSVHRAYSLAKIEKNLNIKATYFLLLGSNFYNIFENEIKKLVLKIVSLGHQIGLHFDLESYDIKTVKELEKYLTFEKNIIENLFQTKINVFSFHNPTEEVLLRYDNFKYAKMINTYGKYFKKKVEYCSDSNGYWRHKRLENFLDENHSKIQVLTHPGWWQKSSMPAFSRIKRCINGRALSVENYYITTLKKLRRKNIY